MQKKKKRVKKKQVKNYPIVDIPPTVLVADPVYYGTQNSRCSNAFTFCRTQGSADKNSTGNHFQNVRKHYDID